MIGKAPILWFSRRQKVVVTSTTKAEYIAAYDIAREGVWLRRLLCDLGEEQIRPTVLFRDNETAVKLITGNADPRRTKHIDLKYHYVKSICDAGLIEVQHISTDIQLADILTKPLTREIFCRLKDRLMIN